MYDIRQFRPTLYLLVLIGICGFALAAEMPAFGLAMTLCLLLNAWLVRSRDLFPCRDGCRPEWWWGRCSTSSTNSPTCALNHAAPGRRTVPGLSANRQVFEQRANRDYSQLLVLSALLMVASAISTYSVVFGLMLIAYLFLALYCWLLFHLKMDAEKARAAQTFPPQMLNAATLRQDQRDPPRSMRRLTWLIAGTAMSVSVLVFLITPRNAGAGFLSDIQLRPSEPLAGFSDRIGYQDVARITQSQEVVARVWLKCKGQSVEGGMLVLRGRTLDHYEHKEWSHSPPSSSDHNHRHVDSTLLPDHPTHPARGASTSCSILSDNPPSFAWPAPKAAMRVCESIKTPWTRRCASRKSRRRRNSFTTFIPITTWATNRLGVHPIRSKSTRKSSKSPMIPKSAANAAGKASPTCAETTRSPKSSRRPDRRQYREISPHEFHLHPRPISRAASFWKPTNRWSFS